jgi:hypothetical protein
MIRSKIYEIAWGQGSHCSLISKYKPHFNGHHNISDCRKSRDAIVISPHPSAARCSYEAQPSWRKREERTVPQPA